MFDEITHLFIEINNCHSVIYYVSASRRTDAGRTAAAQVKIHQRGVQWKQGVEVYIML